MISKVISFGEDRPAAVEAMKGALDSYVIRGLSNNVNFVQDVLRNDVFNGGDTSTAFIAEQYPDGFTGVVLDAAETRQLLVAAALTEWWQVQRSAAGAVGGGGGAPAHGGAQAEAESDLELVLTYGEAVFDAVVTMTDEGTIAVLLEDRAGGAGAETSHSVDDFPWSPGNHLVDVCVDGADVRLQFLEKTPTGVKLQHAGCVADIGVFGPLEHDLFQHMLEPEVRDTSLMLLSPMPGQLVSVSVEVGDVVEAGQELAVVEAMKMQNVLRAAAKGVVAAVKRSPGDSLKLEDVIVEFEAPEEVEE